MYCIVYLVVQQRSESSKPLGDYVRETAATLTPLAKRFVAPEKTGSKRVNQKEEMCRSILQRIFNMPFPTVRPGSWLRNPETGRPLELDCFNEDLKLAVEYDGEQHYQHVKAFHRNPGDFEKQVARDAYKTKICRENGINLIRVPYWIKPEQLEDYIIKQIKHVYANMNLEDSRKVKVSDDTME